MKIYVVVAVWGYEGCSEPLAAFNTSEAALKYAADLKTGDGREVYELILGDPDAAPRKIT